MNNEEINNKISFYHGISKMKILAVFSCFVVCAVYLGIINTTAVKGYEVRKVEQEIEQLKKDNKQLQIEEAELNSFYNIKDNVGNLNMVEAKDVVYIDNNDQSVAVKK
jgi:cell division protein FtsB